MIPIAQPLLDEAEAEAARATVLSGWLTQGEQVMAFEQAFAAYVGAKYACAVSNCTAALHLALLAVGVGPGDEVITVSHSFVATANSIRQCGAKPVFIDIDPRTFNLSPDLIASAVTARTKAILCVPQMGMPCDLPAVIRVARSYGLPVIEDAACATGSEIRGDAGWERIGKPHGDIACFSFHPRKVITTGDGGMLTTANPAFDALFRLWRQHGMNVPDTVRHGAARVIFEEYSVSGFNYRITDIQAAIGRRQLERLPGILARRRALAEVYRERLDNVPGLQSPFEPVWARSNWQSYCVRLARGANQRVIMQTMLDLGIATRRGIMCAHLERAYEAHLLRFLLPQSEQARNECILLPLYAQMTAADQDRVIEGLRQAVGARPESPRCVAAGLMTPIDLGVIHRR
jgi:perosamine synthetase